MRAIWKGAISFGLVSVPVKLYSATENKDVSFNQVRKSDGSRIRYKRIAQADGEEVPYSEIAKGFEAPDGRMVVITDEEIASLGFKSSREIAVDKFVPADEIDPMLLDKSYYLEPDPAAVKPYALLREALESTSRMAIVTISVRQRLTTAVLRVRDGVIVLQTMLWPDEIRSPDFGVLDDIPEPTDQERKMAELLIDTMVGDYDADDYEDDYRAAIEGLVKSKLAGGDAVEAPSPEAPESSGEVVDLLAALQRSVDRAKASRGEGGSGAGSGSGQAAKAGADDSDDADGSDGADGSGAKPAKKSAAKKATTKKATTKTAAKSTAAKTTKKAPAKKAG